jgi:hypothetical protein
MDAASTTHVLVATRQWLRPLVHVLIRCGITWREFAEVARTAYVDVATTRFGKHGRPTNVSRTAMLTGLSRREVRAQRERLDQAPQESHGYVTKVSLVLSAWHSEPEFLDTAGKPAPLPLEGEGASFSSLLRRCGAGDLRPSTILRELRNAGAVRVTEARLVEPLQRTYIPYRMDEELVRSWGTVICDVADTCTYNLIRDPKSAPRFERVALSNRVLVNALPEFREFLNREGQIFLEKVAVWLSAHEAPGAAGAKATVRLGAGVYHLQS